MSLATLIRNMAIAGATPEAIALAVEAIEAEQNKAVEKRERVAARKRDERARRRDGHATVAEQSQDATATGSLDKGSPPDPHSKTQSSDSPLSPPKSKGKKAVELEIPSWLPAEPWAAFVAMRKAMRNVPFTPEAAKGIVGDLDRLRLEGHDPEKLLMKAVKRGWRGVFEADDTRGNNGSAPKVPYEPKTVDELERAIAAREQYGGDPEPFRRQLAELRSRDPPRRRSVVSVGQAAERVANA